MALAFLPLLIHRSFTIPEELVHLLDDNFPDHCEFIFRSHADPFRNYSALFLNPTERIYVSQMLPDSLLCDKGLPSNIACTRLVDIRAPEQMEFIEKGGELHVFVCKCGDYINPSDIEVIVHWPWGWLDKKLYPMLIISWSETVFYVGLITLSIQNRLQHKGDATAIHNLLTGATALHIATSLVSACMYTVANARMGVQRVTLACEVSQGISNFCILLLCLVFVSGLSIARKRISKSTVIGITVVSACFAISNSILCSLFYGNDPDFWSVLFVVVFYFASYGAWGALLVSLSRRTTRLLRRHLAMIHSQGIDPEGTPTFRKIRMLRRVRLVAATGLAVFVACTMIVLFDFAPYWVSTLASILMTAALYTAMCWLYRIRTKIADTCADAPSQFVSNDGELQKWQPGMALPPLPKTSHSATMIHPGVHEMDAVTVDHSEDVAMTPDVIQYEGPTLDPPPEAPRGDKGPTTNSPSP
jgi:hypothetical protein